MIKTTSILLILVMLIAIPAGAMNISDNNGVISISGVAEAGIEAVPVVITNSQNDKVVYIGQIKVGVGGSYSFSYNIPTELSGTNVKITVMDTIDTQRTPTTLNNLSSPTPAPTQIITSPSTPGGGSGGGGGGFSAGSNTGNNFPVIPSEAGGNKNPAPPVKTLFSDLGQADWAREYIEKLSEKGIVSGFGDGLFRPNDNVTREQFVKMLVGALEKTDENATVAFFDVSSEEWYYEYIASAVKHGLVLGRGDGNFGIGDNISREDMAVMAVRAKDFNISGEIKPVLYSDDSWISEYARYSVYILKEANVMNGMTENTFEPKLSVTRAMAAKFICSLID